MSKKKLQTKYAGRADISLELSSPQATATSLEYGAPPTANVRQALGVVDVSVVGGQALPTAVAVTAKQTSASPQPSLAPCRSSPSARSSIVPISQPGGSNSSPQAALLHVSHIPAAIINKFVCKRCPANFNKRTEFRSHLKAQHSLRPVHTCPVCKKVYKQKRGLDDHYRYWHSRPNGKVCNKFACATCKKSFVYQKSIKPHMDTVTHAAKSMLNKSGTDSSHCDVSAGPGAVAPNNTGSSAKLNLAIPQGQPPTSAAETSGASGNQQDHGKKIYFTPQGQSSTTGTAERSGATRSKRNQNKKIYFASREQPSTSAAAESVASGNTQSTGKKIYLAHREKSRTSAAKRSSAARNKQDLGRNIYRTTPRKQPSPSAAAVPRAPGNTQGTGEKIYLATREQPSIGAQSSSARMFVGTHYKLISSSCGPKLTGMSNDVNSTTDQTDGGSHNRFGPTNNTGPGLAGLVLTSQIGGSLPIDNIPTNQSGFGRACPGPTDQNDSLVLLDINSDNHTGRASAALGPNNQTAGPVPVGISLANLSCHGRASLGPSNQTAGFVPIARVVPVRTNQSGGLDFIALNSNNPTGCAFAGLVFINQNGVLVPIGIIPTNSSACGLVGLVPTNQISAPHILVGLSPNNCTGPGWTALGSSNQTGGAIPMDINLPNSSDRGLAVPVPTNQNDVSIPPGLCPYHNLTSHYNGAQLPDGTFQCSLCSKVFSTQLEMTLHWFKSK